MMNTLFVNEKPKIRAGINREKNIPATVREIRIALMDILAKIKYKM
jgi:hypothetical protein